MPDTAEEENDESLMHRIQKGEHQAFAHLVRRHSNRFYGLAYRTLADRDDAEEIVQEAFLKLWDRPELYRHDKGTKFTTWFYRVVANMALDRGRQKRWVNESTAALDFLPDKRQGGEASMLEKEQQIFLEEAIQALPDNQKTALNLCVYEDMSNKEAADILGVSVKALESLLVRAKSGIKNSLIRQGLLEEKSHGT